MNMSLLNNETINAIKESCHNKLGGTVTIGLYQKGIEEYHLFESGGNEVPYKEYKYEIGSITKTFTGYILGKAVTEGKVTLEDRIDKFISNLPSGKVYPTLKSLATHTSGYPADTQEFDKCFIENIEENEYNKINYDEMIRVIKSVEIEEKAYPAVYSNIGVGILGYCLSQIYNRSIDSLIEEYIDFLGLNNTSIVNRKNITNLIPEYKDGKEIGNLIWNKESIIGAAGFLCSTAEDMLKYARSQCDPSNKIIELCHRKHEQFYRGEGLPMDIGLCWVLIPDLNIVFHNGETRCFSSILCIDTKNEIAVVMLSNSLIEELSNIAITQIRQLNN